MTDRIRTPEQILPYRPLRDILEGRSRQVCSVRPTDSASTAIGVMAGRDIGFVLVLDQGALVGVLSERDCVRRMMLVKAPPETTPVADIMVRHVVTVDSGRTFAEGLNLMHQYGIRHLPVVESGNVIGVVSARDLMREAVEHHERIIAELERERVMILASTT